MDQRVHAVILIGGKGKRLRPLSTDAKPKSFLSVTKDRHTMFRKTLDRIRRIIPEENIFVIANRRHVRLVKKDFSKIAKSNLILEPISRNTAPAVALAAFILQKKMEDALMVVLPADHYIPDEKKHLACMAKGIEFALNNEDVIVTLGLKPRFPATVYGYIQLNTDGRHVKAGEVCKAHRFVEKPDLATAKKYLKSNSYLWNCGIFIFRASTILAAVKKFKPEIFRLLKDLKNTERSYKKLPDISIDYAVMEKAGNIFCVKCAHGWDDIGSFKVLRSILRRESRKFTAKGEEITGII